jgi:hypothetical protein
VRGVFRENSNTIAWLQADALQMRCHAARLINDISPCVVEYFAASNGLRQYYAVGRGNFPVVKALKR